MSAVLHIIRHDVRRLRWPLAGWLLLVVLIATLAVVGPPLVVDKRMSVRVLHLASALGTLVQVLFIVVLTSLIVHEDPLVGTDAFWMTRPVDTRALLAAKLALVAVLLAIVPVAVQWVPIVTLGFDAASTGFLALELILQRLVWLSIALGIAVVTPSLSRYILTIVGTLVALIAILMVSAIFEGTHTPPTGPPPLNLADSSPALVALGVILAGTFIAIVTQFRTKRTPVTVALLVATGALATLLSGYWTYPFLAARDPDPPAWTRDPARAAIAWRDPPVAAFDRERIAVNVGAVSMPRNVTADVYASRSQITSADGVIRDASGGWNLPVDRDLTWLETPAPSEWARALGDVWLQPAERSTSDTDSWPGLAKDVNPALKGPLAIRSELEVRLTEYRVVAVLPLAAGQTYRDPSFQVQIQRVGRDEKGRPELRVRTAQLDLMLRPDIRRQRQLILRHRHQRIGLFPIYGREHHASAGYGLGVGVVTMMGESEHTGGTWDVTWSDLPFPAEYGTPGGGSGRTDESWIVDADLLIVESRYIGRVWRHWSATNVPLIAERPIVSSSPAAP